MNQNNIIGLSASVLFISLSFLHPKFILLTPIVIICFATLHWKRKERQEEEKEELNGTRGSSITRSGTSEPGGPGGQAVKHDESMVEEHEEDKEELSVENKTKRGKFWKRLFSLGERMEGENSRKTLKKSFRIKRYFDETAKLFNDVGNLLGENEGKNNSTKRSINNSRELIGSASFAYKKLTK